MSDISASERRLSAALDRIDQFLEAGSMRRSAPVEDSATQLAELQARIQLADSQLADLAHANEQLVTANRALIAAAPDGDTDAVRDALEAEISALRAARTAEIAQLGEIMAELEHYIGGSHSVVGAVLPEVMGDVTGLPGDGSAQGNEEDR